MLLAMAAGGMDALGLLGLGGVFTSALSGNTVLLGISMAQGRLGEAFLCSVVFLGFIPGAILGAAFLRKTPKSPQWNVRTTLALVMECVILMAFVTLLFFIGGSNETMILMPLVFLSSLAMGLQYMTMLRLNVSGVTTTFVTSTVVNLACRLAVPDGGGTEARQGSRWKDRTNRFLASVWVSYFVGAIVSVLLLGWNRMASGIFSLILVVLVVAMTSAIMLGARGNTSMPD